MSDPSYLNTLFVAAKNVKTRCTKIWLLRQAIGHLELLGICLEHNKNLSQYPKSQVVVESSRSNQCCKHVFLIHSKCHLDVILKGVVPVTTETTSTQLGHWTSINALNSSIRRTSSCFRLHLGGYPYVPMLGNTTHPHCLRKSQSILQCCQH